jgi:hypothetical protein
MLNVHNKESNVKSLVSVMLVFVLVVGCFAAMPLTANAAGKWSLEDVEFTDSRGNKVTIPGGEKSCATRIVSFTPGSPWTSDPRAMNPDAALGVPDYDDVAEINYVTLGNKGVIVLEFDVYIYDGPGNDIYVFEIGPDVEATKVEVSNDLVNWIYVGDADGSISGVDMHGKVPADGRYTYVRVTDLHGVGSEWPGADIDAVAGINVLPPSNVGGIEMTTLLIVVVVIVVLAIVGVVVFLLMRKR